MVKRGLMLLVLAMCAARMGWGQAVTAVPALDMNRFTGTWYEIAKLPVKREKRCVRETQVLIALGDKPRAMSLVTGCRTKTGIVDAINDDGKAENKTGDGRLKIVTIWPFSRKYWVLAVGPEYEWALVGSPNHKNLWVLSRTATLTPEVLAEAKGKAAAEGFGLEKLVMVDQTKTAEVSQ